MPSAIFDEETASAVSRLVWLLSILFANFDDSLEIPLALQVLESS